MMKYPILFAVITVFCFSGCGNYEIVDKSKYEVVEKKELEQLKKQTEVSKGIGRYQLHVEGIRMWRLDTATGKLCIWLSSEYDWKDPRTRSSSCN
jgi:hypothetical protein